MSPALAGRFSTTAPPGKPPGDLLNLYFQFLADGLEHIRYSVNVEFVIQIKDLLLLGDLSLFYVYFLD